MESFKPKFSLYNWTPTEMNVERQTHLYHLENKAKILKIFVNIILADLYH